MNINVAETMEPKAESKVVNSRTVKLLIEYRDLVEARERLEVVIMKDSERKLGEVLSCPVWLLLEQVDAMKAYESALKKRMLCYENITYDQLASYMRG